MAEAMKQPDASAGPEKKAKPPWDRDRRTNMVALLLMALATLGSSWNAFQASLWNGKQTFCLMDAVSFAREADERAVTANQLRSVEASLFVEYSRDLYEGKTELSDFMLARMRPEMREAIKAWIGTKPLTNSKAPVSPFVMPEYRVEIDDQARELQDKSSAAYDEAQKANRTSDSYTLLGVLCTSALFLAGLVSGFQEKLMRRLVLVLSLVTLVTVAAMMLRLPVAHIG
jgi:hypothetical protein